LKTTVSTPVTNLAIAREYIDRVFNPHRPEVAAEYFTPNVKWHGRTLGPIDGPDSVVAPLQGFTGGPPDLNAVEEQAFAQGLTAIRHDIGVYSPPWLS
jgi:hypothetical protein